MRTAIICVLLCFVSVVLFAGPAVFIDSRLLVLAHPLFSQFDSETGRFRNTSSEYVAGGQDGVDALVAEIQKLNRWLLDSAKNLQKKLREVPIPDRLAAEKEFLRQKREVEHKLAMMQRRAYNARLVPGRPGVTPDVSVFPQINEIAADIRTVVKTLKKQNRADVVMDIADLLQSKDLIIRKIRSC